jgi:glycerol uptake facilitator-like aquaporin
MSQPLVPALLTELFGNMAFKGLVTTVGLVVTGLECAEGPVGCSPTKPFWATLLAVFILIPKLGFATGGHFNASVSMSAAAAGKLPWSRFVLYVCCQCAGVVLAMSLIRRLAPAAYHGHVSAPRSPLGPAQAALVEMTFGFLNTLIGLSADAFGPQKAWVVSSLVIAQILVSGACMDPTGALAGAYFAQDFAHLLEVYWLPSLFGAALAGLAHRFISSRSGAARGAAKLKAEPGGGEGKPQGRDAGKLRQRRGKAASA